MPGDASGRARLCGRASRVTGAAFHVTSACPDRISRRVSLRGRSRPPRLSRTSIEWSGSSSFSRPSDSTRWAPLGEGITMSSKEIVVGLGHQKSLWPVIHLAEERVRAVHGMAKKIVARSPGIEIEASRPKFEGEFTSIVVRFGPPAPRLKETLQEVAGQAPVRCDVVEVEGGVEFRCPRPRGRRPRRIRSARPATSSPPGSRCRRSGGRTGRTSAWCTSARRRSSRR